MPTSLYAPRDNHYLENGLIILALIGRFHEAQVSNAPEVVIWGKGVSRREFLHVNGMTVEPLFLMDLASEAYDSQTSSMESHINVGYDKDIAIHGLTHAVAKAIGCIGGVGSDPSKLDSGPRKAMDSSRLESFTDWGSKVELECLAKKRHKLISISMGLMLWVF